MGDGDVNISVTYHNGIFTKEDVLSDAFEYVRSPAWSAGVSPSDLRTPQQESVPHLVARLPRRPKFARPHGLIISDTL